MKKTIIIRVCEIFLKGKNRFYFLNLLEEHIKKALDGFTFNFTKLQMRYLIDGFDDFDYEAIIEKLKKVCGIHTISPAYSVESDYEKIKECAIPMCEDWSGTFKVETNRADKTFSIPSVELSRQIGGDILSVYGKNLQVDVKKPQNTLRIDIRENGTTLIYTEVIKGVGGMPIGSSGHGFLMLSGGIDSPVAGYMMAKRGMKLSSVHFHSYPYTGEAAKEKVITLGKLVSEYSAGMTLYVVKFTKIQEAIHERCAEDLMITMMRRFMMRITERLALKYGGQSIITGESLGQVASQTMESITSSNSVVEMPVFRPLIAFDKLETIEIAERIGTYETSILPYEDCCTVFLPKYPAIKPKMERILKEESRLDVESLIDEALSNVEIIRL
ncbi:MAG: tRNA 4-thiouridine(8) synthase ThiI [Clostridiales bacterium]|nr:tRNA 4-thiouridine(8) synthase ThiI [Clostridiales bacterium]